MSRLGVVKLTSWKLWISFMMLSAVFLVHSTSALAVTETIRQPLFVLSTVVWKSPAIPVCFEEDGFADERAWTRAAIAASWEAAGNVRFTGWGRCNSQTSSGLRVRFQDAGGFTMGLGTQLNNKQNGVSLNTWVSSNRVTGWTRERCVRSTAVHEFGHALGFAHEQNRDDRSVDCTDPAQGTDGNTTVGSFDMMSVLNYCNPVRNGDGRLSRGDIAGVRAFYGWSHSHAYAVHSPPDLKTDLMIWRPSEGKWYEFVRERNSGGISQWGQQGDIPVRMDADGDGLKDIVIWRPSEGNWYRKLRVTCRLVGIWPFRKRKCSPDRSLVQWGASGDIPVATDYDGDGIDDYAVWRPSNGNWYVINSSNNTQTVAQWGGQSDVPAAADYDGDGRADFAVWRPSNGNWYIVNSSDGAQPAPVEWGIGGDVPVPGDYDNDGRTDLAVWRPSDGNWYVVNSSDGARWQQQWGVDGDIPVPADYDNDGRTDLAIWRPSEGNWYIVNSSNGATPVWQWGVHGDVPLGASSSY